ncbi:hypothetical protein TNCV_4596401 [Trichonephila clavipes]|uniref:Uncharacterized protein n=1 Tax=Trichonephila clavipes TaxID=2585209 RepID=A0A8X7BKQ0_TRICX|nr:hypothetical protein TNCV_4596401 [Trichonephila clavipes]
MFRVPQKGLQRNFDTWSTQDYLRQWCPFVVVKFVLFNFRSSSGDRHTVAAVPANPLTGFVQDPSFEQLQRRLRHFIFKKSSQFLSLGPWGGSAYFTPRLRPNSIGSLRQAGATEINSVSVPCSPYGGSINQSVTLTLRIPSRNRFTSVLPKERGKNTSSLLEDYIVPFGHYTHPRALNLTSIAVKCSSNEPTLQGSMPSYWFDVEARRGSVA